jgi:hypothetical protein
MFPSWYVNLNITMVLAFFKEYRIARILKQSNITRQAGISVLTYSESYSVSYSLNEV